MLDASTTRPLRRQSILDPSVRPSRLEDEDEGHKRRNVPTQELFTTRETNVLPESSLVESPVSVELRTNIKIPDPVTFAQLFTSYFASRFSRSEDHIGLTIEHGKLLMIGGSMKPAYFLTITSLSMLTPSHNRRHSATISKWLETNIGVQQTRGIIRFVDPGKSNYANGGFTFAPGPLGSCSVDEDNSTYTGEHTPPRRRSSILGSLSSRRTSGYSSRNSSFSSQKE